MGSLILKPLKIPDILGILQSSEATLTTMMKSIFFLAGTALASLSDDDQIDCSGKQGADLDTCEAMDKAFTGSIGKTVRSIDEYCCWCYIGDNHGRGKGQPQDAIDEMCKVLHDGYECAMRDAEDEGTTCVPWEVEYVSAIGGPGIGIAEECSQNNPDSNCAARACTIEGAFIANLLDAFVSGNGIDNSLKHENGFDQATICATKKNGGGPTNKQCCGNYPDRFPFKTQGGDRKCCGNRTFNSLTLKCCDADSSTVKFNC